MNVVITGDEEIILTGKSEIVSQIVDKLIQRIISKYPDAWFIVGTHIGVEKEVVKQTKSLNQLIFNTHKTSEYIPDDSFLAEMADYTIVISNGQTHARLDKIRANSERRLEVNYLLGNERWY